MMRYVEQLELKGSWQVDWIRGVLLSLTRVTLPGMNLVQKKHETCFTCYQSQSDRVLFITRVTRSNFITYHAVTGSELNMIKLTPSHP